MERLKQYTYYILRKTEKYTKIDMIYATKSGFWLMSNQVFGAAISLIISVLFAHYLSKDVFGTYKYILSIAGLATAFSLTGMNTAVTRAVAQGFDAIFKQALLVQFKWSVPQFLFSIALSAYYFYHANTIYGISFLVISILAPISSIANTYGAFLQGKKDFRTTTVYSALSNSAYFVAMTLVIVWSQNILTLVLTYYIINTSTNVFFCWRTLKKHDSKNTEILAEDITFGKHVSAMNIVGSIASQTDNIVLYHFLGPAQLAIYSFATIIPERIRSMFGIISVAALPRFSEKSKTQDDHGVLSKSFRLIGLSIILVIIYVLCAPYIYKLFFPQYESSLYYSQVYSISLLVIAAYIPFPSLWAKKLQKELYIISIGLPILKIIVSTVTIILWGIWGAIIAKIIHYVLHLSLSLYFASPHRQQ